MFRMPRGRGAARAVLLPAVLLTVLLGACQRRASIPDAVPSPVDGLYFVDRQDLSVPKLLLLERGRFELLDGQERALHGTFEARDGLLRLKPADASSRSVLETTYAVVEGRLLLGVLRRTGGEPHVWTSVTFPPEFLGQRPSDALFPAAFRIDWDMKAGQWRFTSGARQVVLEGVARLELPDRPGRLLPMFRPRAPGDAGNASAFLFEERDGVLMDLGTGSPFGMRTHPAAPLVWDGELVRLHDASADLQTHTRMLFDRGALAYERRGDIVVTPWTMDLGPVGLVPVRADPAALAGTYVSGDQELVVSTQPPPPKDSVRDAFPFTVGPSRARTCHYTPDARGLAFWTLVEDHMMGHGDEPYTAVCFALADGRVVRYISSGGCNGATLPRLDVFQRR